jgi:hypothetical protein
MRCTTLRRNARRQQRVDARPYHIARTCTLEPPLNLPM